MTQAEWLTSDDPEPMVRALPVDCFQRELRLFTTACVRRVWELLPEECRAAVEMSERFAENCAAERDLAQAVAVADSAARIILPGHSAPTAKTYAVSAAIDAASIWPRSAAIVLAATSCAASAVAATTAEAADESRYDQVFQSAWQEELSVQADILRGQVDFVNAYESTIERR